ncbi:MAG TPA: hypothetical protein VEC06_05010 [Paucimonas sp.]|nr:hypothetical protein [Paucimonas sp.]
MKIKDLRAIAQVLFCCVRNLYGNYSLDFAEQMWTVPCALIEALNQDRHGIVAAYDQYSANRIVTTRDLIALITTSGLSLLMCIDSMQWLRKDQLEPCGWTLGALLDLRSFIGGRRDEISMATDFSEENATMRKVCPKTVLRVVI